MSFAMTIPNDINMVLLLFILMHYNGSGYETCGFQTANFIAKMNLV
jgi:hypothetical protein